MPDTTEFTNFQLTPEYRLVPIPLQVTEEWLNKFGFEGWSIAGQFGNQLLFMRISRARVVTTSACEACPEAHLRAEWAIENSLRLKSEIARLRAAITTAPHRDQCAIFNPGGHNCNCWKSRTLRGALDGATPAATTDSSGSSVPHA